LGLAVLIVGMREEGEMPGGSSLRSILIVGSAVVVFAIGVRPLGLVPVVFISSLLFSLAGREFQPGPAAIAALVLTLGAWGLFIIGLRMPWAAFGWLIS